MGQDPLVRGSAGPRVRGSGECATRRPSGLADQRTSGPSGSRQQQRGQHRNVGGNKVGAGEIDAAALRQDPPGQERVRDDCQTATEEGFGGHGVAWGKTGASAKATILGRLNAFPGEKAVWRQRIVAPGYDWLSAALGAPVDARTAITTSWMAATIVAGSSSGIQWPLRSAAMWRPRVERRARAS